MGKHAYQAPSQSYYKDWVASHIKTKESSNVVTRYMTCKGRYNLISEACFVW